MLIFALSITPKRFLHEAFAKHTDSRTKKNSDNPYQLGHQGYNCEIDNLVAQSAFDSDQYSLRFPLFSFFTPYIFKNISFFSAPEIYSALRGPPVTI